MKNARAGQADLSKRFALAAGLAALTLTMLLLASRAGEPAADRPDYSLGYTVHRTDLPGYSANRVTSRAFVVEGDGDGSTELAPELVSKPHQYTQFGGWSPDGRQAYLYQTWDSPENGAWEDQHGAWRFSPARSDCKSQHAHGGLSVPM